MFRNYPKHVSKSLRTVLAAAFLALVAQLVTTSPSEAVKDIRSAIEGDTRVFSIEVRDAEVRDVLNALAQQSGINIITGEGVEGKVTLSFKEIRFHDALEIIIKASGLTYTIQNNVFWVDKEVDLSEDITTDIVRLNYADPDEAVAKLDGVLSDNGRAFADRRTNSVVVRDLDKNLARAREILLAVDTRTPQVVIEARIVEATSNFTRQLGVQWGGTYSSGGDVVTGSHLLPESTGDRSFAVNLPATNPTSGLGVIIGSISNNLLLDLEISAAESKGDLRIVSRPRISTMNNKPASIHSGLTFRVKLSQAILEEGTAGGAAITSTAGTLAGLEEIKTGIDLTVTPQVAPDGYILLNIETSKSDPDFTNEVDGIPGVAEKSANTNVLIKDGDTVVIGGLYKTITTEDDNWVPYLANLPVIGSLFRSTSRSRQNEELLVFITPKIVKYNSNTANATTEAPN